MKYLSILFCILLIACSTTTQQTEQAVEEPAPKVEYPDALESNLRAHGYEAWKSFNGLTYTRISGDNSEKQQIDLKNRKVRIETDEYTLGSDGENVWVSPNLEAFGGRSARFFHNLWFYFFSIPHVMTDPGVNARVMEDVTFNGTDYNRILVTFGDNVGDAPEDQYILYINKETSELDLINYSVTFYDASRAEQYNALVYDGWQTIQGVKVPASLTGYRWENDTLGEVRYEVKFEDIQFSKESFDQSIFYIPEGAEIDKGVR